MRLTIGQSLISHQLFTLIFIFNSVLSFARNHHESSSSDQQLIALENGLVKGKTEQILDSKVTSFLGIPYAEPPTGDGRFRKAKPFRSQFDGVYNATYFRPACVQKVGDEAFENLGGVWFSEDCLHVNIWVPGSNNQDHRGPLKPVVFYVFASAFAKASPARPHHRGDILSAVGDVIVVLPNYRLGFLGFACCGKELDDMPGNLGIHDIILALKWTRENIRRFGGDPDAITLSGASAGGIISILMMHSTEVPESWIKNIFVMSGVPANTATVDYIDVGLAKTRAITEKVGCSRVSDQNTTKKPLSKEEIDCLRTSANLTAILELQDSDEIVSIGSSIKNGILPVYGDSLIPSLPELSFRRPSRYDVRPHRKSFVLGNVENEGSWKRGFWFTNKSEALDYVLPKLRSMLKTESVETWTLVNHTIDFYFNSVGENDDSRVNKAMNTFYSDWNFRCASIDYGQQSTLDGNLVHLYLFDYVPRFYTKPDGESERPFGATHGDDSKLIFGYPFRDPYNYGHHDRQVSRYMMNLYSDFIKNRRLSWPPILVSKSGHLEPLRLKINGHLDSKDIDVVHLTDHCNKLNKLRNHKLYESRVDNEVD